MGMIAEYAITGRFTPVTLGNQIERSAADGASDLPSKQQSRFAGLAASDILLNRTDVRPWL
jgi:hypothetical protein